MPIAGWVPSRVRGRPDVSRAPRLLTLAAIWAGLLSGCAPESAPGTDGVPGGGPEAPAPDRGAQVALRDDAGREVRVSAAPRRIVSLVPSTTELLLAMGAGPRLVGRTDWDRDPRIAHLPSLGGGLDPSVEALALLRPDLVILTPGEGARPTVERIEALGIPVFLGAIGTMEDFRRTARTLGTLLGGREAHRSDSILAAVDETFAALRAARPARRDPTAVFVVSIDPAVVAGGGTFPEEVMAAAGARNTFADLPGGWPRISMEEVLLRDPDFVLLPAGTPGESPVRQEVPERLRDAPGWSRLPAVREGRVLVLDPDLFTRAGPRIPIAATALAHALMGWSPGDPPR